jgi:glutamine amidotransferase
MKVTIFDYGAGNLHSLAKALANDDVNVHIESRAEAAIETDALILPGVGAFGLAAERLVSGRQTMQRALHDGLPCLGICLGMQLLFERSDEGEGAGLGILQGAATRIRARRVPHIGWNTIDHPSDPLFAVAPLPIAYFANGYACRPRSGEVVTAWTEHEDDRFPAAVRLGRVVGVQFHPEKSSMAGVRFIQAFLEEAGR